MHKAKLNKELIYCFPWSGRCSAIHRGARPPSGVTVTWEVKCHHSKCPLLTSTLYMMSHSLDYPFAQFGSPVLVRALGVSSKQPQLPHHKGSTKKQKRPWLCVSPAQQ